MNKNAVTHASLESRFRLVPIVGLVTAAMLLVALVGTAGAAAPVGKDGSIHACYRVKGKLKGTLRVVPSAKKRCKRGERKVTWSVAGPSGQTGAGGQAGGSGQATANGQAGQAGANGTSAGEAALVSKIAALTLKLESLEGVLDGVTNDDLLGALGALDGLNNADLLDTVDTLKGLDKAELIGAVDAVKGLTNSDLLDSIDAVKGLTNGDLLSSVNAVKGLTNGELLGSIDAVKGLTNGDLSSAVDAVAGLTNTGLSEAVASLPVIDDLCTQATGLTKQVNDTGKGFSEISLGGILPVGLTLKTPTLAPLGAFAC